MKMRGVALLIAAVILGISSVVSAEGSQKSEWEIYDESYEWIDGKPAEHPDSSWSTVRSEIRDVLLEERQGDESPADDWWIYEEMPDADAEQAERSRILKEQEEKKRVDKQNRRNRRKRYRFKLFMEDDGYRYYFDRLQSHWVRVPYTAEEYMADVWLRLVPVEKVQEEPVSEEEQRLPRYMRERLEQERLAKEALKPKPTPDTRPAHYYLVHYYLRPMRRQLQFISELEVFDRPDNNIEEPAYRPNAWENLVPHSVESDMYYKVLKIMRSSPQNPAIRDMKAADFLEKVFRISL